MTKRITYLLIFLLLAQTSVSSFPSLTTTHVAFSEEGVCEPPSNLTVSQITPTSSTVSWTPVQGVNQYQCVLIDLNTNQIVISIITNDSFVNFTNLTPGHVYEVRILSICGANQGAPSSIIFPNGGLLITDLTVQITGSVGILPQTRFYLFNSSNDPLSNKYFHIMNLSGGGQTFIKISKTAVGDAPEGYYINLGHNNSNENVPYWRTFDATGNIPIFPKEFYTPFAILKYGEANAITFSIERSADLTQTWLVCDPSPSFIISMIEPDPGLSGLMQPTNPSLITEIESLNQEESEVSESDVSTSSIQPNTTNEQTLTISPNPFNTSLYINGPGPQTVVLMNLNGVVCRQYDQANWNNEILTQDLPLGVYLLRYETPTQIFTKKIIKIE